MKKVRTFIIYAILSFFFIISFNTFNASEITNPHFQENLDFIRMYIAKINDLVFVPYKMTPFALSQIQITQLAQNSNSIQEIVDYINRLADIYLKENFNYWQLNTEIDWVYLSRILLNIAIFLSLFVFTYIWFGVIEPPDPESDVPPPPPVVEEKPKRRRKPTTREIIWAVRRIYRI